MKEKIEDIKYREKKGAKIERRKWRPACGGGGEISAKPGQQLAKQHLAAAAARRGGVGENSAAHQQSAAAAA